jgi:hypothetical protein
MKLIFSLIFFVSLQSYARDVILIENEASADEGILLRKILMEKFHFPQELITTREKTLCTVKSEAIIHLCLKRDGELEIKKVNQYVVKNSLGVFLNGSEE